ncbi:GntR domain protein [Ruminiclostridium papyrosolvens DSM 2782]|uniref:GntR domain protein n=1 Tax=Ruminiclostridium papyrosolvens DSM 2782 TaxID=588581 RepID=F1T8V0_9FIRM|nr:FadR/GntR family transcriptional regulator [Ruminiclostridium papyrosolvens]EGD48932.1 GntR domain protein [Ruminiclostridium papyrosolvens DSM 2782]WES35416.1 FadR/GntR family transcriptional regulator [Ruminiclostridium papyrosolvens DSM 2782]
MPIKKVTRQSVSEQVFEQLKEQILNNEWQKGEKIPSENELSALLGVSRVTVRNALQKLISLGLIETRFGEGSFITDALPGISMNSLIPIAYLKENSLQEILEYRRVMEGNVAELATKKASPEDVAKLEEAYLAMDKVKDDLEQFSKADLNFHLLLANTTKNSLIIQTFYIFSDVLNRAFSQIVTKRGNSAGIYYHKLLLEAVKDGNSLEAKRIMDEHMEDLYNTFETNM